MMHVDSAERMQFRSNLVPHTESRECVNDVHWQNILWSVFNGKVFFKISCKYHLYWVPSPPNCYPTNESLVISIYSIYSFIYFNLFNVFFKWSWEYLFLIQDIPVLCSALIMGRKWLQITQSHGQMADQMINPTTVASSYSITQTPDSSISVASCCFFEKRLYYSHPPAASCLHIRLLPPRNHESQPSRSSFHSPAVF